VSTIPVPRPHDNYKSPGVQWVDVNVQAKIDDLRTRKPTSVDFVKVTTPTTSPRTVKTRTCADRLCRHFVFEFYGICLHARWGNRGCSKTPAATRDQLTEYMPWTWFPTALLPCRPWVYDDD